jgi:hypothetical protein
MRLPVKVAWTTQSSQGETSSETRDVSSRGVFFYLPKEMKSGTAVELMMTLPHEITMAGPVNVRCLGRVVRTEPREGQRVGVVVAIDRYEFMRGHNAA